MDSGYEYQQHSGWKAAKLCRGVYEISRKFSKYSEKIYSRTLMINDDLCPNVRLLDKGFSVYCESVCEISLTGVAVKPQYNGLGTIKAPQK